MRGRRLGGLIVLLAFLLPGGVLAPRPAAAQPGCTPETERNEPETNAQLMAGTFCLTGDLPPGDQDFIVWDVPGGTAGATRTLRLTGAPEILTLLGVYALDPTPGAPIVAGPRLFELRHEIGAFEPAAAEDLLLPNRLLLGLGRSDRPDGTMPDVTSWTLEAIGGESLPPSGDVEPNDTPDQASPVEGTFSVSGDLAGTADTFEWVVPEEQPADGFRLDARGVAGTRVVLTLYDQEGRTIASTFADELGLASLRDLRLAPGAVTLLVNGGPPEGPSPYILASRPDVGPGDIEPNDDPIHAEAMELGSPSLGRLTGPSDIDLFRLPASEAGGPRLIDVRLIWRADVDRELCLRRFDLGSVQCRRGKGGLVLRDLLLTDDGYLLAVTGAPVPLDPYALRVDATSAPAPDWESEPNDTPEVADPLPPDLEIRAAGGADDWDVFTAVATGQPELWRLDVEGEGIDRTEWLRTDGTTMADAEVVDGTSARILDMYFVPGQRQLFRVRATGEYRLALEPLGPPDPNGEREPNDGLAFTEALPFEIDRTGRLATTADVDEYRFTTTATDHLVLHLEAPADGDLDARLYDDAAVFGFTNVLQPGEQRDVDVLLRTGDYRLVMSSKAPGEDRYGLRLDRSDPYELSLDQEPNDSQGWASPLTGDGRVMGDGRPDADIDWYRLPALDKPTVITIITEDGVRGIDLHIDGQSDVVSMEADPDGFTFRSPPLEPGRSHELQVFPDGGDYAFHVEGLPDRAAMAPSSDLSLGMDVPTADVAAFWPAGQRVTGTLTLTAGENVPGPLRVEVTTSDDRWSVVLAEPELTVQPGATASVPFDVLVPRDVPAGRPVRVTSRVLGPDGAQITAAIEITPRRDAAPIDPYRAWSVPDRLLGGQDLASPALGAVLLASVDPVGEGALHDGFAPTDGGLWGPIAGLPLDITVDLAGEGPVPIAGTILNAMSADPRFSESPDRFELDLSEDGVEWEPALSGSLERTIRDQSFVLEEPIEARFARLRVLSTHGEGAGRISLGEWKVIAVPGTRSPVEPIDVAEPILGGHVVWTAPQLSRIELATSMIDEDPTVLEPVPAEPQTKLSWAIGFHEGRAARITSMEWTDPPGSDPALRFERLDVAISEDGPLGPYREVGTWELERAADGSVPAFELDAPTWARFVRFMTDATAKDARYLELPAAMRIFEAPTADGYRSILGQWGLGERAGPFEASTEPAAGIADDPDDDSREDPRPLAVEAEATGRARLGQDTDWYAVSIPSGQRALHAVVSGDPYVGVEVVLHEPDGAEVPMSFGTGERPGTVLYEATVEPGTDYVLEVRQPPSSVVVTFDTSVSVGPYLDAILGSLRGFGADVIPGREAIRILPFDGEPLLPGWNDQPFELEAAAATYLLNVSSSGAEESLLKATTDLVPRRGARAILIITDAASSSYTSTAKLWDALASVRPLVFAVQTGGLNEAPSWQRHHLMTDWAASAGGVYRYANSKADIEDAFDHLATWLRRPAGYRLTVTTSPDELAPPEPGSLTVTAPTDASGRAGVVLAGNAAVGVILDTSGTMLESSRGERRIDVAKRVLVDLLDQGLPPGTRVAMRAFGSRCSSDLLVPLGPLDPSAAIASILDREVRRKTPTPMAATIEKIAEDLAGAVGPHVVVVLTDGARDNCDGDPEAAILSLRESGADVRLNVVGFALDRRDREVSERLAELGGGAYFDARNGDDLSAALRAAVSAPFRIIGEDGAVIAEGAVGGAPVSLPTGTYVVEVAVEPEVRFDEVYVAPGGTVELTLPTSEDSGAVPAETP